MHIDDTSPIYSPLNYAEHQIRVLVVEAGAFGSTIKARFEQTNLDDSSITQADFHALSYCWGDSVERRGIMFETGTRSSIYYVSATVERAMRRLRRLDASLHIWIDAVCINQDDLDERASQVTLMGEIYSRAKEVQVWLDDEILGVQEALRFIRDVYNYKHRLCLGGDQCKCSGTRHALTLGELEAISTQTKRNAHFAFVYGVFDKHRTFFNSALVEAAGGEGDLNLAYFLQTFFHHPWFQRVWVIQEAILAQKTTVHSASEAIDWDEVLMINDITSSPEFATSALNVRTRNSIPSVWKTLIEERKRRDNSGKANTEKGAGKALKPDLVFFSLELRQEAHVAVHRKRVKPPLTILQARDKLFALLPFGSETGRPGEIPRPLRPDYSRPLASIMAGFTRWWIEEYRSSRSCLSFIANLHAPGVARCVTRTRSSPQLSHFQPGLSEPGDIPNGPR